MSVEIPRLLGSCRLHLALYVASGLGLLLFLRFNFTIALLCMVGNKSNGTESKESKGEFSWSKNDQAVVLGAYFYGFILTQIPGGWLTNKIRPKIILVSFMAIIAVLVMVTPILARYDYWLLFASRFIQGALTGICVPSLYATVGAWTVPSERATLISLMFVGGPISTLTASPTSSMLCTTGIDGGWPMTFYFSGALFLLWSVLFQFFTTESPNTHPRISQKEKVYLNANLCKIGKDPTVNIKTPWRAILTSGPVMTAVLTHVMLNCIFYLMGINLPIFVDEVFKVGILENGFICGIPYMFQLAISLSGGFVDYLEKKKFCTTLTLRKIFTCSGMFSAGLALALLPSLSFSRLAQFILISVVIAFFILPVTGGFTITHHEMAGHFRDGGVTFGIANCAAAIPGFVIPIGIAYMAPNGTQEEWDDVFYTASAIVTLGGVIYIIFADNSRQPWVDGNTKKVVM